MRFERGRETERMRGRETERKRQRVVYVRMQDIISDCIRSVFDCSNVNRKQVEESNKQIKQRRRHCRKEIKYDQIDQVDQKKKEQQECEFKSSHRKRKQ